ncbi:MAG: hypothetical protein WCW29_04450 [Candidatus Paceibacterota bacterium]|jgi:hypothetical protein
MNKNTLLIGGVIVVLVGAGLYAYKGVSETKSLGGQIPAEQGQIESLQSFINTANVASGITSGAVFNYKPNGYGNPANFTVTRCVDEVRCDIAIRLEVARFQQSNSPSEDLAEVDILTNKVVSLHRAVPSYVTRDDISQAEIESIAREFISIVYPEFSSVESSLAYDPGMKRGRLNNGNYFFRWNDMSYKLPEGLSMDIPPFIQVGITSSGFIFGYDNTIQIARNISKEEINTTAQ